MREDRLDEELTRDELKVLWKYVGNLNWLAANKRPDIVIYALELAKKQKKATLKDLREVIRILKKVHEKESKVVFKRIGDKKELCIVGVCDASYHCDDKSVAGEIVMLGNKETTDALPIYWKLGVIRKVCLSPKAAETRALIRLVDDGMSMARQVLPLMDVDVKTRVFTIHDPCWNGLEFQDK